MTRPSAANNFPAKSFILDANAAIAVLFMEIFFFGNKSMDSEFALILFSELAGH